MPINWACSWQAAQVFELVVNILSPFIVCEVPSISCPQQLQLCAESWWFALLKLVSMFLCKSRRFPRSFDSRLSFLHAYDDRLDFSTYVQVLQVLP